MCMCAGRFDGMHDDTSRLPHAHAAVLLNVVAIQTHCCSFRAVVLYMGLVSLAWPAVALDPFPIVLLLHARNI